MKINKLFLSDFFAFVRVQMIKNWFGLNGDASKDVASSRPKLLSLIIFIQCKSAKELPSWNISLEELRTSELDMLQKMAFFSISDQFVLWASCPVVLQTSVKHFVQMLPWCTIWRLYRNSSQSWSIKWIQSYGRRERQPRAQIYTFYRKGQHIF